jgi:hypothetical protein
MSPPKYLINKPFQSDGENEIRFNFRPYPSIMVHAVITTRQFESLELLEIFMLGLVARWGHNVLLAAMGVVTITFLVLAR